MKTGPHHLLLVSSAVVIAAVTTALAMVVWSRTGGGQRRATELERLGVYGEVPAFTLTERSGRVVGREDLRGKVSVVDFIYTECTETCPTQSLQLAQLRREFEDTADLRLVSITVDPEHDTPEVLRRYAERYGADQRWWFLTGDKREIYCLAQEGFHLGAVDPSDPSPPACGRRVRLGPARAWASHGSKGLVMHSARFVVVDRALRIRAYHLATDPASLRSLHVTLKTLFAE